jgi:hypothetical protein
MDHETLSPDQSALAETWQSPLGEIAVTERNSNGPITGVMIGTLIGIDDAGRPWVDFSGAPSASGLAARSTTSVSKDDMGRMVALMFEGGDPRRPILIGFIQNPLDVMISATNASGDRVAETKVDGERVVLKADHEIVLQCGKASITLTRAGKVLLRGAYVSSRSSGVNRIKGGSVQIN